MTAVIYVDGVVFNSQGVENMVNDERGFPQVVVDDRTYV